MHTQQQTIRSIIFNWFFLGILIFFLVLSVGAFFLSKRMISQMVSKDSERISLFVAQNVRSQIKSELHALDRIVARQHKSELNLHKLQKDILQLLDHTQFFTAIHIYKINGDLISHHRRNDVPKYNPDQNIQNTREQNVYGIMKEAVEKKVPLLTEIKITRSKFAYQVYFIPIVDQSNEVKTVVSAAFSPKFDSLNRIIEGLNLSSSNFVFLSEPNLGVFAYHGPHLSESIQQNLMSSALQKSFRLGDSEYKIYTAKIPELNYSVSFGVDMAEVSEKQKTVVKYLFALLLISLLISVRISSVIGKRLSIPFERLIESLKQIHLGNFNHRINYPKKDEIGYLCHLLDQCAEKLERDRCLGMYWTNDQELQKIKEGRDI